MANDVMFDQKGSVFIFRKPEGFLGRKFVELRVDRSSGTWDADVLGHKIHVERPYHGQKLQDLFVVAKIFKEIVPGLHQPSKLLGAKDSAADSGRPLVNALIETQKSLCETFNGMAGDLDALGYRKFADEMRSLKDEINQLPI